MEYRLGMNREYGAKWFVFYAKVRPWLVCLGFLTTVADFWQYTDVYFEYWWLMLYFLGAIVQVAFSVTVCKQSSDTYPRFVKFVKGVLAYETIFMPYSMGVQRYVNSAFSLSDAVVSFVIGLALSYFLWYRLNVKYFEKRLMHAVIPRVHVAQNHTECVGEAAVKNEASEYCLSYAGEQVRNPGRFDAHGRDMLVQKPETKFEKANPDVEDAAQDFAATEEPQTDDVSLSEETTPIRYCRRCGWKLLEDSLYCGKCGTKIEE